jgi:hypothetical protein
MTDLLSIVQAVLQDAGYGVRLIPMDRSTFIGFEDDDVMGFASTFETPLALLQTWNAVETSLLRRYAPQFRSATEKSWNIYSVFVCATRGTEQQTRQVRWIEENLQRTRKIAACGISSRHEVVQALLPILPLQNQPLIQPEDLTLRLHSRIEALAPSVRFAALDDHVAPEEVVRLLNDQP